MELRRHPVWREFQRALAEGVERLRTVIAPEGAPVSLDSALFLQEWGIPPRAWGVTLNEPEDFLERRTEEMVLLHEGKEAASCLFIVGTTGGAVAAVASGRIDEIVWASGERALLCASIPLFVVTGVVARLATNHIESLKKTRKNSHAVKAKTALGVVRDALSIFDPAGVAQCSYLVDTIDLYKAELG